MLLPFQSISRSITPPDSWYRLLLSLAELNGDRNEWVSQSVSHSSYATCPSCVSEAHKQGPAQGQATTHSCTAWKLLAGETGSADAQLEAVSQHTRACLAAGQEDRASALLQQLVRAKALCNLISSRLRWPQLAYPEWKRLHTCAGQIMMSRQSIFFKEAMRRDHVCYT